MIHPRLCSETMLLVLSNCFQVSTCSFFVEEIFTTAIAIITSESVFAMRVVMVGGRHDLLARYLFTDDRFC